MTERGFAAPTSELRSYIEIDYQPSTEDPARIFRAMARLLDAFLIVDRDLTRATGIAVEPTLVLERVEAGSVRAWIRTVLSEVDDDALHNLDWKPLVGQYLVKAKHLLLEWLDDRETINARAELLDLQRRLAALAPTWDARLMLANPIPPARLLEDVRLIAEATSELREGERVLYVSDEQETVLDTELQLSSEEIETLLTEQVVTSESRLNLLIKKPDHLGNSMWEFKLDDRLIEAKILDEPWLRRFRAGKVALRAGDALDAKVRSELHRGFEGNVVTTRHFVLLVYRIVHQQNTEQPELLT